MKKTIVILTLLLTVAIADTASCNYYMKSADKHKELAMVASNEDIKRAENQMVLEALINAKYECDFSEKEIVRIEKIIEYQKNLLED